MPEARTTLAPFEPEDPSATGLSSAVDLSASALYVDELFDEISALPGQMREAALAARCAGHPSMEAEVRALLRVTELDEPVAPALSVEAGAMLGRYRLERPLGTGATASVWMAFDTQLHSFTALKLLHADGLVRGAGALDAVMTEARAASGIISDHVVRIKTAGRFEAGPHFIEMELCAEHRAAADGTELLEIGRTLAEMELESITDKVRLVAEAARGVDAAHRVGVLHRDLKPGNILITPVSRRAKVTDFGLAAEARYPAPTEETPITATVTVVMEAEGGRIVGTPAYMPPEQALGHPATRTGDVYALGATLYALLIDRSPYAPDGRHPIPALDILAQVRAGPPRPLTEVAAVPARLARIVEKAMRRSARNRYRTAADLASDLEAWLADRRTSIDGPAPGLRVLLFARRNREVVGTAAVLLLVLLAFAAGLGWLDLRRRELEASIAVARQELSEAVDAATTAAEVRDRLDQEKNLALEQARLALEARQLAVQGESNAEARWRTEVERRLSAEKGMGDAELARVAAEQQRQEAAAARVVALELSDAAEERARLFEASFQSEEALRIRAEEELRASRIELVEAERDAEVLELRLAAEDEARVAAIRERDDLQEALEVLRAAMGSLLTTPAPSPSPDPNPP